MGNGDKYLQWKSLKFDKSRLLRFDPNSLEFRIQRWKNQQDFHCFYEWLFLDFRFTIWNFEVLLSKKLRKSFNLA